MVAGLALLVLLALLVTAHAPGGAPTPAAFRRITTTASPQLAAVRENWERPRLAPGTVLGQLSIPRLGWSGHFVEGTSSYGITGEPGHVLTSAYPGEADNVVLFARRSLLGDVTRLQPGDRLSVTMSYGSYTYGVQAAGAYPGSDTAPLGSTPGPELTLATDNGVGNSYLAVRALLVPQSPQEKEQIDAEIAIAQSQQSGLPGSGIASLLVPVAGPITQGFGPTDVAIELPYVYDGVYYPRFHTGIDIAANTGTPVHAAAAGTVVLATAEVEGGQLAGYGRYVMLAHGEGYYTLYGHLSRIDVAVGESVDAGQVIGLVGSTGRSTGPHLHFEVRHDRQLLDPLAYLAQP
jgi:murein DD-endopeptidase MepM/ murein hydrolase activator NlpD